MSTLDSLWTGSPIMVQNSSGYSAIIKIKLGNGWYEGQLIELCPIGYFESTYILVQGNQAIWSVL